MASALVQETSSSNRRFLKSVADGYFATIFYELEAKPGVTMSDVNHYFDLADEPDVKMNPDMLVLRFFADANNKSFTVMQTFSSEASFMLHGTLITPETLSLMRKVWTIKGAEVYGGSTLVRSGLGGIFEIHAEDYMGGYQRFESAEDSSLYEILIAAECIFGLAFFLCALGSLAELLRKK